MIVCLPVADLPAGTTITLEHSDGQRTPRVTKLGRYGGLRLQWVQRWDALPALPARLSVVPVPSGARYLRAVWTMEGPAL